MTTSSSPSPSGPLTGKDRPLSPHLQVWRWTLTMALSILHRATGCALAAGSLMLVWWLASAAIGPGAYDTFSTFAASDLGQVCLFGWMFAMYLHLCTGVRHLIMDTGRLLTIREADRFGILILLVAGVLSAGTWAYLKGLI